MKIHQSITSSAYMVRNDGTFIPVKVHIYASQSNNPNYDPAQTAYAAEWLYHNTNKEEIKDIILQFVWKFILDQVQDRKPQSYITFLKSIGYKIISIQFCQFVIDNHKESNQDLDTLNDIVVKQLNQQFLRARYGGLYNSWPGSNQIYFRISSKGFNWFNIIWQFVYDNKRQISNVTVCRDWQSDNTDPHNIKYLYHNGQILSHIPVDQFINLSGNPVLQSNSNTYINQLKLGKSVLQAFNNMNYKRAIHKYSMLSDSIKYTQDTDNYDL